jgi:hypothetical protein
LCQPYRNLSGSIITWIDDHIGKQKFFQVFKPRDIFYSL